MSDLFDKRPTTKPGADFDKKASKAAKKESQTLEQQKAQRKTRIISISVISVFLIAFLFALVINSNFIRREIDVITIDGVGFSAAEFDYFYVTSYIEYSQMIEQEFPDMAQFFLPQRGAPLSQQINPSTGEPWQDFFMERAIKSMTDIVQRYNKAMALGFVLPDEKREEMESEIEFMEMQVEFGGFPSLDSFLKQNFGPAMNVKTYLKLIEMNSIAMAFEQSIIPEFVFTQEELEEYYNENRDLLDVFTFRYFTIRPDIDLEAVDYEAAAAEAFTAAEIKAHTIVSTIFTEDDFIIHAMEYDPFEYYDPESTLITLQGEQIPGVINEWLNAEGRNFGDTAAINDNTDAIHIVFYLWRDDNSYLLTSFRQLLFLRQDPMDPINPDDFPDDEQYWAEFFRLDNEAFVLASDFEQRFINLGANEAAIDQLVMEGENEGLELDGNLYDNIAKVQIQAPNPNLNSTMKVVQEIEDWLFSYDRQYGDFELIRTEDFGFHLSLFMGFGERFSDVIAKNRLTEKETNLAFEAFVDSLPAAEVTKSRLFSLLTSPESFT